MASRLGWIVIALPGLFACGDDSTGSGGAGGSGGGSSESTTSTTSATTGSTGGGDATGGGGASTGDAAGGAGGGDGGAGAAGTGGEGGAGAGGGAALPEPCPDEPVLQSPASFAPDGIEPELTATCETVGSEWIPCHEHYHCGPEHTGATICGEAECEVHTVHRRRKDGEEAAEVRDIHEGTVGGNCEPADHDILVRSRFVAFSDACEVGIAEALTYCGSATGNNVIDADQDGSVSCDEAGFNAVSVRWCIETACVCLPGLTPEDLDLGEEESTKVQGCAG